MHEHMHTKTHRGVQVSLAVHCQVQLGLNSLNSHHPKTHRDEIEQSWNFKNVKMLQFQFDSSPMYSTGTPGFLKSVETQWVQKYTNVALFFFLLYLTIDYICLTGFITTYSQILQEEWKTLIETSWFLEHWKRGIFTWGGEGRHSIRNHSAH